MYNNHDEWLVNCVWLDSVTLRRRQTELSGESVSVDNDKRRKERKSWDKKYFRTRGAISLFLIHKWPAWPIRRWFKRRDLSTLKTVHNHCKIIKWCVCEAKRIDNKLWFLSHYSWLESRQRGPLHRLSEAVGDFERVLPQKAFAFTCRGCATKVQFIIYLTTHPHPPAGAKRASLTAAALCILRVRSV